MEWPLVKLGEICASDRFSIAIGPFGSRIKADCYVPTGVPVIRGTNISSGRTWSGNWVYVSEDFADGLPNCIARAGDLVLPHRGAIGEVGLVPDDGQKYLISSSLMKIRFAPELAESRYVFYYLSSDAGRNEILRFGSQVGTPGIGQPLSSLRQMRVPLPPIDDQRAIADILSALDDKIELNRRMNETLEAMTRVLFAQWSMATVHQAQRISVAQLQKAGVLAIGDGYRAKNEELGGAGLPFIRAGELKSGFDIASADILNENSVTKASDKRSRIGDVAFTSKGTVGRFARVTTHTPDFVYSPQVCFWRSLDPMKIRPSILFMWMTSPDLRSQIDAVSGNTDMAPYVSLSDQKRMTLPVFGEEQHVLADQLDILLDKHAHNDFESRTLAATRDALLPKLMSGEIRLRDAKALAA